MQQLTCVPETWILHRLTGTLFQYENVPFPSTSLDVLNHGDPNKEHWQ